MRLFVIICKTQRGFNKLFLQHRFVTAARLELVFSYNNLHLMISLNFCTEISGKFLYGNTDSR